MPGKRRPTPGRRRPTRADQQMVEVPIDRIPEFDRLLGIDRIRSGGGRAEVALDLRKELTNHRGVAHGGLITSLLDVALGSAIISGIRSEEWIGTVQLSVQFREPGVGTSLTARGRMMRRGRHVVFAEGEIVDDEDRIVATAHGTWHVWPSRPRTPRRPA